MKGTTMTHTHYMRWLKIACLITIATGIACALASYPATDVVWRTLFDLLKWPFDGDPAAFSADTRAVNAVLGGTMVGWASPHAVRLVCLVCGGL
jgi:hypothetical protein